MLDNFIKILFREIFGKIFDSVKLIADAQVQMLLFRVVFAI